MAAKKVRFGLMLLIALALAGTFLLLNLVSIGAQHIRNVYQQPQRATKFDLSDLNIPIAEIRGGGPPKDGIPAISNPRVVLANQASFLKKNDRVVGVSIDGHSRAYPISILTQHEIVNDRLGEKLIAVTYCPLCDSVVVFNRITALGEKEFGVSGLLYNSNVLMYDRSDKESLWSQMKLEGVSGLAKGIKLDVLPMELTRWGSWKLRHPATEVLSNDTGHRRNYTRNPYAEYFKQADLMFPAHPQSDQLPLKERIVAIWDDQDSLVVPARHFKRRSGTVVGTLNGKSFEVEYEAASDSLRVVSADSLKWANSFWFAWYAFHPTAKVYQK